jgi:hypothetical protein
MARMASINRRDFVVTSTAATKTFPARQYDAAVCELSNWQERFDTANDVARS